MTTVQHKTHIGREDIEWYDGTETFERISSTGELITMTKVGDVINVKNPPFSAVGDGVMDDTNAISNAIASIGTSTGGVVYFPPGKYVITSEISINKNGLILLGIGSRHGGGGLDTDKGSYIIPGDNIAGSIFKFDYYSGTTSSRGCGVMNLSFMDDYGTGANQGRNYTLNAAIEIHGSDQFYMENCDFERLKGRAIWTKRCAKGSFRNIDIFRCGDTSKPALDIDATDATYYTQGTTFDRIALEVCYGAEYLDINANNKNNKFSKLGFETDNEIADSEQRYILCAGDWNQFIAIHFNKNSGTDTKFKISGIENIVSNFVCASFEDADCIEITGTRNQLSAISFRGTNNVEYGVNINGGDYNRIDGITARYCAGVSIASESIGNTINGLTHLQGKTATVKDVGQETNLIDINSDEFQDAAPIIDLDGNDVRLNGFHLRDSPDATYGVDANGLRGTIQNGHCKVLASATAINLGASTSNMIVSGNHINSCNAAIVDGNSSDTATRIYDNTGSEEIATAGNPTLQIFDASKLDSSEGVIAATLPDGKYMGQIKTIVMTDATNSSTVTITHHETEDNEVATFDAVDETLVLMWTGTQWVTIKATCTFL